MYHSLQAIRKPAMILIVLWISIIAILTSCSKKEYDESGAFIQQPPITIMAPLHFPHAPSQEVMNQIEQLTGAKLDIEWVQDGIYADKMNTALTTNSLKKVTFVKYTDYIIMKNSIRSGAFWEIGPYLQDYPNLKHLDNDILNQAAVDGKIYGLYTERPSSRQGIIIRKDWLDQLKLDVPENLEELYEVLYQFTYNDPDRDGLDDTIGLTDRNDLVFGAFKTLSSYFGTPNNWKAMNNQLIPEFETPQYMDTMNFMRKLYQEQLINQDFAVTSKQVQRDMLIRGTAGVYIGSMTDVQRLQEEASKINPEAQFTLINRMNGPYGYRVWSIPNYNGLYLFSKSAIKTEDELKRILAFFDRTMDTDVSNIMRYGFEGRHYELDSQGKIVLPQESYQLRANEVNALHALMIADLSNPNLTKVDEYEPMMQFAEQLSADNEKFIVPDPTIGLDSMTYDEHGMELYTIISDATYNYILGGLDETGFAEMIEQWKQKGGQLIIEEYTEAYRHK